MRCYGGVGFSLNCMPTIWRVQNDARSTLTGILSLDREAQEDLTKIAQELDTFAQDVGFHAVLDSCADQHVGLGTKTSLCMGLIAAVNILKNLDLIPILSKSDSLGIPKSAAK
jgi:predicted sugar kinase